MLLIYASHKLVMKWHQLKIRELTITRTRENSLTWRICNVFKKILKDIFPFRSSKQLANANNDELAEHEYGEECFLSLTSACRTKKKTNEQELQSMNMIYNQWFLKIRQEKLPQQHENMKCVYLHVLTLQNFNDIQTPVN